MPLQAIQSLYKVILCFVPRDGINVHGLAIDAKTVLGPWVHVANDEVLIRMVTYLGATDQQVADYEAQRRSWGQGSVHISVLGGNRKNLLKIDWSKL